MRTLKTKKKKKAPNTCALKPNLVKQQQEEDHSNTTVSLRQL